MIKEADQREEKRRIRKREKELREAHGRQIIDKS